MLQVEQQEVFKNITYGCAWVANHTIWKIGYQINVFSIPSLNWRHNETDGVSNHRPWYCLLNCLFRCSSKKTSKLCVTGLCVENSPGTGEFPTQKASNAENVSIRWRHHVWAIFYHHKPFSAQHIALTYYWILVAIWRYMAW